MKRNLILDHKHNRILMSRDFARRYINTEGEEFKHFQTVRMAYPTYTVEVGVIKKNENKESYKGLTYLYMERYIFAHGTKEDMEEYRNMQFLSECHRVKYPAIKKWFLEKYPDVVRYGASEDLISEPACAA